MQNTPGLRVSLTDGRAWEHKFPVHTQLGFKGFRISTNAWPYGFAMLAILTASRLPGATSTYIA